METYVQWIGTIGFPIIAYLLMFFKLDKSITELTKVVQELCDKEGDK